MAIMEKYNWDMVTTDDAFGGSRGPDSGSREPDRGKYKRGIDKLALIRIAEKYDLPIDVVLGKFLDSMKSKLGFATKPSDSGEFSTLKEHFDRRPRGRESIPTVNIAEEQFIESKQLNRAERELIARQKAAGNTKSDQDWYDTLAWNRNDPEDRGDLDSLIYGENAGAAGWVGEVDELRRPPTAPPPNIVRVEEDFVGDIEKELAAWTPPPRQGGKYGKGLGATDEVTEEAIAFEYPEVAGDPELDSLDYNPRHEEHQKATGELIANLMPQGDDAPSKKWNEELESTQSQEDLNPVMDEGFLVADRLGPHAGPTLSSDLIDPFAAPPAIVAEGVVERTEGEGGQHTPQAQKLAGLTATPSGEGAIKSAAKLAADKALGTEVAAADTSADDTALLEAIGAAGIPALQNLTRGLAAAGKPRNRAYKETMARMQQSRNVGNIDAAHTRHDKSTMARRAASDLAAQAGGVVEGVTSSQRSLVKQGKEAKLASDRATEKAAKDKAAADAVVREDKWRDRQQKNIEGDTASKATKRAADTQRGKNVNLEAARSNKAGEEFNWAKLINSKDQKGLDRKFQKNMKALDRAVQRERIAASQGSGKEPKRGKKAESTKMLDKTIRANKNSMNSLVREIRSKAEVSLTKAWLERAEEVDNLINAIWTKTRSVSDEYTEKEKGRLIQLMTYQEYLRRIGPRDNVAIDPIPKPILNDGAEPLATREAANNLGPVKKKG
jgi:hypothetical protein